MNTEESLLIQHEQLRRRFEEMMSMLGQQRGVGWDDCVNCDMDRFRAALKDFTRDLRGHEATETRALSALLDASSPGRRQLKKAYAKSHETLDHLVKLLSTTTALEHGEHVYALRSIASRVRQELESHFVYEEKEVLPLLLGIKAHRHALREE